MNPFAFSCLFVILTALPLGYFVYAQNKTRLVNAVWLLYSLALCVWGTFGILIAQTSSPDLALIYWRFAMAFGIIWMPVLFYHFAYLYAPWKEKRLLIGAYIITALFSISAFTPYYIPKVELVFNSMYWSRPGLFFYFLTAWWFILTGYSHTKLYKDSKSMPKERQDQIKYFIFASVIGYMGGLLDFSITYGLNIYPWGNFLIVIYPFIMTFAIIQHGLFDIFIFIKRAFYSALLVGIIAWAVGSIGVVNIYLQNTIGLAPWVAPILAGVVSVYAIYLFLYNFRKTEKVKQEFITIAAHKLRTPLTHIRYITEELKQQKSKEELDTLVSKLEESTGTLLQLVNTLLDVANFEMQSEKYEFGIIDIPATTTTVLQNTEPLRQHKQIELVHETADGDLKAEGNEKNIIFVIQSLIENAMIYTPEHGKVTIKISQDKKNIIWSITDTGIGISKEDIEKVFDKFFRGQNALRTDTDGTGLAMFMARNLIKRQGGSMTVTSPGIGLGTTFTFTLPKASK